MYILTHFKYISKVVLHIFLFYNIICFGDVYMNNKIFISHGDIILDKIYDNNLKLIKQDGGGCNWNDLYNLSAMGEECYAIGSVGNDEEGKLAISSLQRAGVNTSYVVVEDKKTNIMNIIIPSDKLEDNSVIHSWYCPITMQYTMNFSNNLPTTLSNCIKDKEIYLILDKFFPINMEFIKNISSSKKICLDVGHIRFIEHFTKQYLLEFFKLANFIQLNDNVSSLLFERLNVKDEEELFDILGLDLLILTKGKKGAVYVYRDDSKIEKLEVSPKIIVDAVDTSGAGDAFFSVNVREYAYSDKIDKTFLEKTFELANQASRNIISKMGSRM